MSHNEADVLGLSGLMPLIAYKNFFETPLRLYKAEARKYSAYDESEGEELLLCFHIEDPLSKPILASRGGCFLRADGSGGERADGSPGNSDSPGNGGACIPRAAPAGRRSRKIHRGIHSAEGIPAHRRSCRRDPFSLRGRRFKAGELHADPGHQRRGLRL